MLKKIVNKLTHFGTRSCDGNCDSSDFHTAHLNLVGRIHLWSYSK